MSGHIWNDMRGEETSKSPPLKVMNEFIFASPKHKFAVFFPVSTMCPFRNFW